MLWPEGEATLRTDGGRSGRSEQAAAYEEAMQQEERRAQWHAEMRRDAFGA